MKQFALPGAKWHDCVHLIRPHQKACYSTDKVATSIKEDSQCRDNESKSSLTGVEEKSTNLKWLQINPQVIKKETIWQLKWQKQHKNIYITHVKTTSRREMVKAVWYKPEISTKPHGLGGNLNNAEAAQQTTQKNYCSETEMNVGQLRGLKKWLWAHFGDILLCFPNSLFPQRQNFSISGFYRENK